MAFSEIRNLIALIPSDRSLICEKLDDLYIVFQPASAETHVFNETTFLILERLKNGPCSLDGVKSWTEESLGVLLGEIDIDEFAFATRRLEELGLIEFLNDAEPTQ